VQVRLLGPVDVTVDGVPRPVPGLRRKAVLAVLGLHAGQIVSTDRLIDVVWGDRAPATAPNTLQSHVSYLRRVLGASPAILTRSPGYVLSAPHDVTDLQTAERLIRQSRQGEEPAQTASCLQAALGLWRGRSLQDVAGLPWLDEQAERLEHVRLDAVEALLDARLALGEHARLVPELEDLAVSHPYREQVHADLMLALYRAGRQADALIAYQRLRRALDEDLGIAPSPALRNLETAVLRQDPALDSLQVHITVSGSPAARVVPAQLPPAVRAFAGRADELALLDAMLPTAGAAETPTAAAVVISAVSGTAGVGKTTLAVHWAHRVAARFPDGQLYVNLRGFDPSGSAADPADVLREFLDALGVPAERLPAGVESRAGLYRSVLAGKRVLVLLDNARDVGQVRPLLPGSAGCLALVTSRNELTPLVVAEGAQPLTVDLLSPAEARDLLKRRLGAVRVMAERAAVDEIITRCARLPIALSVVAARAATRANVALAELAAELADAAGALAVLEGGDAGTDVRAVLSWSYRALGPDAARLFRLLGLHPGPDVTVAAAAVLADVSVRRLRELLNELTRAHLVAEQAAGRFAFHDLLRAYASELAGSADADADRRAALSRMLDHYVHTVCGAARLLDPGRGPAPLLAPEPVPAQGLCDVEQAMLWLTSERAVLTAVARQALAAGFETHAWQLAWALDDFLERRGHWHDWAAVQSVALQAARRLADRPRQARAHRSLGRAYVRLGRYDEAYVELRHALALYRELDDVAGQAHTHHNIGGMFELQGRHDEMLDHTQQALDLYRAAGDVSGQAVTLNAVGWCHALRGDHQLALEYCEQALALLRELGDRAGQAGAWDSVGFAHHHLGHFGQAIACYSRALELIRDLGDRYAEADVLTHLGDSQHAAGDRVEARRTWRDALIILDQLGHPDAEQVRARLGRLAPSAVDARAVTLLRAPTSPP
jgi:DNA-binding SARP family transcriptional activator/Tfp pilus assembly protein PilF